jgi:hypothetical protein
MNKTYLLFVFLCSIASVVMGQQNTFINNKDTLLAHLKKNSYAINGDASAVILSESATLHIASNQYTTTLAIEKTIKILKDDAINSLGNIEIFENTSTSIRNIEAYTYNLDQDSIIITKLDDKHILNEKINAHTDLKKITLAQVKKGCIIHYSYTKEYKTDYQIDDWYFEKEYPILESTYNIIIPNYIKYVVLERSYTPFIKVTRAAELNNYAAGKYSEAWAQNQTFYCWKRYAIPAFKLEPNMFAINNFRDRIRIHINSINTAQFNNVIAPDWHLINEKYLYQNQSGIGSALNPPAFLKTIVDSLIANADNDLDKGKLLFQWVRNNITIKPSIALDNYDFNKIYKSRIASKAEINVFLCAMLNTAGLHAEPLVIATRDKEMLQESFPRIDNIDFIGCYVMINGKATLLDASSINIPFGILLPECYNGYARLVSSKGGAVVLDPDMLSNNNLTIVNIKPALDNNNLLVNITQQLGVINSYVFRNRWRQQASEWLLEQIQNNANLDRQTYAVTTAHIEHLDYPDTPIILHYQLEMHWDSVNHTHYLNPYLYPFVTRNPYSDPKRKYPIALDYQEDNQYIINVQLPEGYRFENTPTDILLQLDDSGEISFTQELYIDDNYLSLKNTFNISKTTFPIEAYPDIKAMYEAIAKAQHQIVIIQKSP